MAWLQAHPVDDGGNAAPLSRAEQIQRDGGHISLPDVTATHLCAYLHTVGFCGPSGMAMAPLTSQELLAWQHGSGTPLAPWEFSAMLGASKAYVSQYYSKDATPPFGSQADLADPAVVDQRIRQALAPRTVPAAH